MKRLTFILVILSSLFIFTRCVDANVTKLKSEVSKANSVCPVNLGMVGDMLSVKYQESENRVIFYFSINEELAGGLFKEKNKEKIHSQMFMTLSNHNSKQMLKDIINAKASLMMIYKAPSSGSTIKFELSSKELKEIAENPMTESEIEKFTISNKVDIENSRCPYEMEYGINTTKVALVDNMIVYYCEVDEDQYDMREIRKQKSEIKEIIRGNIRNMHKDPSIQRELALLVKHNMGYQYRYYGKNSKEFINLILSPEELAQYTR